MFNGDYKNLETWQLSVQLVKKIYKTTKHFPREELFSLCDQIKRSAVSIPSNIAEGYGRDSIKDLIHFLHISLGSLYELETQIYISYEVELISKTEFESLQETIELLKKLLNNLIIFHKKRNNNIR